MDNNKKVKIYIGLLITVTILIGVTYAYYRLYKTQTNDNVIGTRSCLDTSFTEDTSEIILSDAFPIDDSDGLQEDPFSFTLTNNCDSYVNVQITLYSEYRTSTSSTYLKDDYVKVNLSPKGLTKASSDILNTLSLGDIDTTRKGYILEETGLKGNETKSYDLRLWIDANTTNEQGLNKTWKGKIIVTVTAAKEILSPKGWDSAKDGSLLAAIKRDNELKSPITTPGQEVSAYTFNDITETIKMDMFSDSKQYYITYGTGWEANGNKFNLTGTAVTTDTYINSYTSLVGKYLTADFCILIGSSTAGIMKETTNLKSIYYVVSATEDAIYYKKISSNKNTTESVLASTEDDYGISYYFRGVVENNYVEYANMCWRIVRVTGDGSIKLVLYNYNGLTDGNNAPSSSTPCNATEDTFAYARYEGDNYESWFNEISDDNAFAGLMHGNIGCSDGLSVIQTRCIDAGGTWTASTSYANAHENTNPSTILTNLNKWYSNVLSKQSGFSDTQLADTIWCNDKSVVTDTIFNPGKYTLGTNYGYGTNNNYYSATQRLVQASSRSAGGTGPSLICPNDNNGGKLSKFTVSDTEYGNGSLRGYAKVGLLTVDEIAFAGGAYSLSNSAYYLRKNAITGSSWWTLSPAYFYNGVNNIYNTGAYLDGGVSSSSSGNGGVRPSLSLVSTTKVSGEGTATNPYKVQM